MSRSFNIAGQPYIGPVKRHIIHLIRLHNLSDVMRILNAAPATTWEEERNLTIIPRPLGICYPTLLRFARSDGIKVRGRGRPKSK